MARLGSYTKDENLEDNDLIIGSEQGTGRTINIPLSALSSFIGGGDATLSQARIESAITNNPEFRVSIGIETLTLVEYTSLVGVGSDVEGGVQSNVLYNITDD